MKDPKLLVRSKVTSKKIYLFRRERGSDFHVRFTPPLHIRQRLGIRERVVASTGHKEVAPAKERAAAIIESYWKDDGRAAAETRDRAEFATLGQILDRYGAKAKERPRTIRNNANALRMLVRTVLGGDPDGKPSAVLTPGLVRKFDEGRLNKRSTASHLRQARSVVAPLKMRFYEGMKLPDLTGFRTEPVDAPRLSRPRPLDMNALTAMEAAAPALAESDPGVYVAHLMFSRWAMRNIEILHARRHWIVDGKLGIIDRPEEDFYPKGSEGWIPIAPDVLAEILRFEHLCVDGYLIPGKDKTERHRTIYRRHSQWVSTWIKDHRKTSYELRRYAGSRLLDKGATLIQVRDFLRHRSQATTENWYLYRLQNRDLPVIGMNDLAPAVAVA